MTSVTQSSTITGIAYTEIHPAESAETVTAFASRGLRSYAGVGVQPQRLQTGPGQESLAAESC
jgi:hypothetical protein